MGNTISKLMIQIKNSNYKEFTKTLISIIVPLCLALVVVFILGIFFYAIFIGTPQDNQLRKKWEEATTIDTSCSPLQVLKFSFDGHQYLSFYCDKIPTIRTSVVHNPDCPCTQKTTNNHGNN